LIRDVDHHDLVSIGQRSVPRIAQSEIAMKQPFVHDSLKETQRSDSAVGEQEDAVVGVRTLQVSGRYILGGTDSKSFEHLGQQIDQVDNFFLLDTRTGSRTQFKTYGALRGRALELKIDPNLQPIDSVYAKYRFSLV